MKYARLYPHATAFQEVEDKLFRVIEERSCVVCFSVTQFLDYSVGQKPRAMCSEECLWQFAETTFPGITQPRKRGPYGP